MTPTPPEDPSVSGDRAHRERRGAELGLLLLAVIWGVNFSVIKATLEYFHPLAFNALRFPLASLLLWGVLRSRGAVPFPRRSDLARVLALGIFGNVVYQFFFIFGIDFTRAGNAALLLATVPVWTTILSTARRHERPPAVVWVGVVGTFLGMFLLVAGGEATLELGRSTLPGDLLCVGAAVLWSVYTVESRPLVVRYGSMPMTAWTLWVGTVGLVLVGMPFLAAVPLGQVTALAWGGVVYAGVLGIGTAYLLWYRGVRSLGSSRTAVYSNLVPVVALGAAWLWLGEVPTLLQGVGAGVILASLTLTRVPAGGGAELRETRRG